MSTPVNGHGSQKPELDPRPFETELEVMREKMLELVTSTALQFTEAQREIVFMAALGQAFGLYAAEIAERNNIPTSIAMLTAKQNLQAIINSTLLENHQPEGESN